MSSVEIQNTLACTTEMNDIAADGYSSSTTTLTTETSDSKIVHDSSRTYENTDTEYNQPSHGTFHTKSVSKSTQRQLRTRRISPKNKVLLGGAFVLFVIARGAMAFAIKNFSVTKNSESKNEMSEECYTVPDNIIVANQAADITTTAKTNSILKNCIKYKSIALATAASVGGVLTYLFCNLYQNKDTTTETKEDVYSVIEQIGSDIMKTNSQKAEDYYPLIEKFHQALERYREIRRKEDAKYEFGKNDLRVIEPGFDTLTLLDDIVVGELIDFGEDLQERPDLGQALLDVEKMKQTLYLWRGEDSESNTAQDQDGFFGLGYRFCGMGNTWIVSFDLQTGKLYVRHEGGTSGYDFIYEEYRRSQFFDTELPLMREAKGLFVDIRAFLDHNTNEKAYNSIEKVSSDIMKINSEEAEDYYPLIEKLHQALETYSEIRRKEDNKYDFGKNDIVGVFSEHFNMPVNFGSEAEETLISLEKMKESLYLLSENGTTNGFFDLAEVYGGMGTSNFLSFDLRNGKLYVRGEGGEYYASKAAFEKYRCSEWFTQGLPKVQKIDNAFVGWETFLDYQTA